MSPSDEPDETSFAQEYDARAKQTQTVHIYCRLCRRIFPVAFRPRREARLRCKCGHEAILGEFDVYKTEKRARDFADLYEKIYRAAKDALREANLPIPPSGKFPQIRDGLEIPSDEIHVRDGDAEDRSDIASSYVGDGSDVRGTEASLREGELRSRIEEAQGVLERHEALSELVEHLYCVRHVEPGARERFEEACREDVDLASQVVAEALRRKRAGTPARVAFSSFKHLAIVLEEEEAFAAALEVVEAAVKLGLPGYRERADALRARLGPRSSRSGRARPERGSGERPAHASARRAPPPEESEEPRGLLSSSSDAVIPSSEDLDVLDDG